VAVVFVARLVARDWDDVGASLTGAHAGWMVAAGVLAVGGMTAIAVPWRKVLRMFGSDLSYRSVVARYYVGEIAKYVPGGVWPVVGRGELAVRGGVPRAAAYGSVALSLAALYLSAMFLVLATLPWMVANAGSLGYLWVLAILPLGLAGLHPAVLRRAHAALQRLLRRDLAVVIPRWGDSLALLLQYLPAWVLIGTATWTVARGLGQDVGWFDIAPAAVLSWVVGFVLVPVPGGVGVREIAFVATATSLDPGVGAAVALVARMLFVVVDSIGLALASAWLARAQTRAPIMVHGSGVRTATRSK
jgi:glycosyltransferase 2 family protein